MSVESTREVMTRYFEAEHDDTSMMTDDVVFTSMNTGQEFRGPDAVLGMLNYFYHIAFEARAEPVNLVIADGKAIGEWMFVGRHTGEYAGIPATNKEIRVPLCVTYDLENDKIRRARVYFLNDVLFQQLGAFPPSQASG